MPPLSRTRRLLRNAFLAVAGGASLHMAFPASSVGGLALLDFAADPLYVALVLTLLVVSLGVHEAAHAWAADLCGDPTARQLGRLTLNPMAHIDWMWTVAIPAFFLLTSGFLFGGAKPVPVDFHRLRSPWRDMSLVAAAGPLSNLLLAALFLFLWKLAVHTGFYNGAAESLYSRPADLLPRVLDTLVSVNVLLMVFNLIPIPPLDGSRITAWLLPKELRPRYMALERWGLFLVFALIWLVPGFNALQRDAIHWVEGVLEAIIGLGGAW
jgi:Zn-dependent protease